MGQQAEEAEGEVVVQDHGVDGVVADHVAGFQQLGELPLGLQGDVHQGGRAGVPEQRSPCHPRF